MAISWIKIKAAVATGIAAAAGLAAVPATSMAYTSSGGSCSHGVGGGLDDLPSGFVNCDDGVWVDSRPGATSSASWTASADYGQLHAFATVAVNTAHNGPTPLALSISAKSGAIAVDTLTFDAPGLTGQMGLMTFLMAIDGSMSEQKAGSNSGAYADWQFTVQTGQVGKLFGTQGDSGGISHFHNDPPAGTPIVGGVYGFEMPIIFGEPMLLLTSLEVSAGASGWRAGTPNQPEYYLPTTSTATSNFGHTAAWAGITGLTRSDGTPVTGWTVSSASGFDYASAVPEPATWAMLLFGALGLALQGRRPRARD